MDSRKKTQLGKIWSHFLGRDMSNRLGRLIMPGLLWNQEIYGRVLERYLTRETVWLDAGCGHQILPRSLNDFERVLAAKPRLIVGVDLEQRTLRKHESLQLAICSSLERLPFPAESFDLVTCNMVAGHLLDPSTTFRELAAVLRPDGLLIVHTPNALSYGVCVGRLAKSLLPRRAIQAFIRWSTTRKEEDIFPTFYRCNTRRKLRRLLGAEGLSEEACWMLTGPREIFNFFAPFAFAELLIKRTTLFRPLRRFRTAILGVYRKSTLAKACRSAPLGREVWEATRTMQLVASCRSKRG